MRPLTALGTVQEAINFLCPALIKAGYQPIIFHASGVGGQIMEDFIERRTFCGVIDLSRKRIDGSHHPGGFHNAGPHRLRGGWKNRKFPQVIIPGPLAYPPSPGVPKKPSRKNGETCRCTTTTLAYTLLRPTHEEDETDRGRRSSAS